MQFELAKDAEKLAKRLIREDHNDLASKNIVFVYELKKDKNDQSVAMMRKGKQKVADVKILGGLTAFLISGEETTDINGPDAFPVVTISKHAWTQMTPEQRLAAIDAQLCKLDYDVETGRPTLIDYDVQAHTRNVKKYGAWSRNLHLFLAAAKQAPLFEHLPEIAETAEVTQSTEPNAAQQAKILKGNGKDNGKADEAPKPDNNVLRDIKEEVARRRGRPASTQK